MKFSLSYIRRITRYYDTAEKASFSALQTTSPRQIATPTAIPQIDAEIPKLPFVRIESYRALGQIRSSRSSSFLTEAWQSQMAMPRMSLAPWSIISVVKRRRIALL